MKYASTFLNIPRPQVHADLRVTSTKWEGKELRSKSKCVELEFQIKEKERNRKSHLSSKWYRYVANQSSFIGNYVIAFKVIAINVEMKRTRKRREDKKKADKS